MWPVEPANQLVSTEARYSNFTEARMEGRVEGDSLSTQCVIVPFFVRGMRALSSPRTALIDQDYAHILDPASPCGGVGVPRLSSYRSSFFTVQRGALIASQ